MSQFNFEMYEKRVNDIFIKKSLNKQNEDELVDILLADYIKENLVIIQKSKQLKQIQMKTGILWQIAIGEYDKFTNLGEGHETGLDVLSCERKIIMEIKNRYNTDNHSARKSNLDKLAKYKKEHPEYTCIYGIINCNTKNGKHMIIKHNNVNINYYSGDELLNFIFGDNKNKIITILKKIINSFALNNE